MMKYIDVCQSLADSGTGYRYMGASHVHETGISAPASGAPCCVPSRGSNVLQVEDAVQLAARFKALSDPNRLRILSIVSANKDAETCVCDLPEPLGLKQPTVSHHLKILVDAGILHREKRGVWAYFSVVPGALESLGAILSDQK